MAREQYHSHDHILAVQAHGESPKPWAATEFTDGGTLADYFDADLDASQWFAHGLVRAVSHAHALGVVHGGLCPPAVRFSTSLGSTWPAPKIGDWGLAVVVMDERELPGSHSMGRQPPISPAYAAPEHLDPGAFGTIDHSTDVYGLRTLLYGLFTGQPPFSGESHVVAGQVTTDDPPTPTERNPNLPEEVDTVLSRSLAKRKQARYETVDDLLVALERCTGVVSV
ncbi:protein kinase domain-containing protein [Haladaptatus pallidirubidus]|uniref:Protein kinase domain-containing protein n=1 Tax=Haladaptatus pallidirubidus TaxID=1008152 RepID=A0AAV3UN66_9EURY|nr:protein kinase [Haladaptatus pallidirubidus]